MKCAHYVNTLLRVATRRESLCVGILSFQTLCFISVDIPCIFGSTKGGEQNDKAGIIDAGFRRWRMARDNRIGGAGGPSVFGDVASGL
jgi:hypothetical protein